MKKIRYYFKISLICLLIFLFNFLLYPSFASIQEKSSIEIIQSKNALIDTEALATYNEKILSFNYNNIKLCSVLGNTQQSSEFIILAKISECSENLIIPLVIYYKGKYYSAWDRLDSIINTNKFWLYYKGKLVGIFYKSENKNPINDVYSRPCIEGYIYWIDKPSDKFEEIASNTVVLNKELPQLFYPQELVLDPIQKLELSRTIKKILREDSIALTDLYDVHELKYRYSLKDIDSYNYEIEENIMDMDQDGQPEAYLSISWKKEEHVDFYTIMFLTWRSNNWIILKHSTFSSESYEELINVGEEPFYPEIITDIEGDGIPEVILTCVSNYEVSSYEFYQLRNGKFEKILDIGGFGL